ncbi:glycosyltransferase family 2 protein [Flammeovirga sp. SJP92]|uniref:glycosyltransferase family 2 protein n=1 Tax=Flammeovirga sp. SJP92 TaxID=1775430 RepID=UPI00078728B7|nr:glycosyltransferase family 2 protein [Flammeovirga sp. SJP92]KXX70409.1 hypothetical protein AVL50_09010 [Flammeovirga sp. SJP92]
MNNNPKVSVIMPAYNCEQYIEKAINSIVNQTYSNWELLIADDGSSDNTKNIIDNFKDKRIFCYHNEQNLGNLHTSNKLFNLCTGDLITIQDADDWSTTDRLKLQVNEFLNDKELCLCGTQSIKITNDQKILKKSCFPSSHIEIKKALPNEFLFTSASIMIKKKLLDEFGGYPLFFNRKGGVDWYWFGKMILKYKMINIKEQTYFYRYNPESITNKIPSDPNNMIIGRLVVYLLNQNLKYGKDGLGNDEELKNNFNCYHESLLEKYIKDKYLLKREYHIRRFQNNKEMKSLFFLFMNFISSPKYFVKYILNKLL